MRTGMLIPVLASASVAADTEIYRCRLADGTVAFQETPCPEPAEDTENGDETGASLDEPGAPDASGDDDVFDFINPFDEPASPPEPSDPALPEPVSGSRAECEKRTRDAIDAIDLEMRENDYSEEQGQEYLAELLVLTRQLRACKQL